MIGVASLRFEDSVEFGCWRSEDKATEILMLPIILYFSTLVRLLTGSELEQVVLPFLFCAASDLLFVVLLKALKTL